MDGTGSLTTFLFLQEEPRLRRAVLVISKLNVLFTQHHFWARSADEAQCNPLSSQRKPSLWFSGAVCVTWGISAAWIGRRSQTWQEKWKWIFEAPQQRRAIPTWMICVPLFYTTVLLAPCSSSISPGYTVHFWRRDLLLPHTYGRNFNYNQALQSYCNANKNISSLGEVLLFYELDIQSTHVYTRRQKLEEAALELLQWHDCFPVLHMARVTKGRVS